MEAIKVKTVKVYFCKEGFNIGSGNNMFIILTILVAIAVTLN